MKAAQTTLNFSNLQEIQILYRNKAKKSDRPIVKSSQDAYDYLIGAWSPQIERLEEFVILCLNRANKVLGFSKISSGGISGTVADPKVIFQVALKSNASSILLAHNHPSGNTNPSDNDIQLTKKLKKAGEFLELNVLDHLIITPHTYFSFADESLL
jgi:DNA repair protein RadC